MMVAMATMKQKIRSMEPSTSWGSRSSRMEGSLQKNPTLAGPITLPTYSMVNPRVTAKRISRIGRFDAAKNVVGFWRSAILVGNISIPVADMFVSTTFFFNKWSSCASSSSVSQSVNKQKRKQARNTNCNEKNTRKMYINFYGGKNNCFKSRVLFLQRLMKIY